MRVAVIGAGITGLIAAYRLSQKGHQVVVFEKEKYAGGQAAGFERKNWRWPLDNFFHHLFVSDEEVKRLVAELNLSDKLFYLRPKTSIFYRNKISQFDSPFSVLAFPHLSFPEKLRTGLVTAYLKLKTLKTPRMVVRLKNTSEASAVSSAESVAAAVKRGWDVRRPEWTPRRWKFEKVTAEKWLKKYYGQKSYQILWQPLLQGKFAAEAEKISMAWFWARIKKRSSRLGYLKGGFQVLTNELVKRIEKNGGQFYLKTAVAKITSDGGRLSLRSHDSSCRRHSLWRRTAEVNGFDKIIITTPAEKFLDVKLPKMLGAINLILVLKEKFLTDGTYWLNINKPNFPFVAVVEHTNFVHPKFYGGNRIVYVGGYYSQNHRYFKMNARQIFNEFLPYLKKINLKFNVLRVTCYVLHTSRFAQPVIPINYSKIIPKFKTSIPNVYLANMQMVYPWDRGINYAIEMGEKVANEIIAGL